MTNPTTPFNWQMPTSTDLVTDLPADFETFGQAVATSMADLLGGTTGQILSKASNTDMDFTWVTNDIGDITAVTAGTGLSGGGTSGAVSLAIDSTVATLTGTQTLTNKTLTSPALTTPTISTLTTNGDTIYGTGSGAISRLGIGSTGNVLTVAGGVPTWAAPAASGGMTLLSTTAITSTATISITGIDQTYSQLVIVLSNAATASTNVSVNFRFNSVTSGTLYSSVFTTNSGTGVTASMGDSFCKLNNGGTTFAANTNNITGVITIPRYADATPAKVMQTAVTFVDNAGDPRIVTGAAHFRTTSAISSLQMYLSAGNWTAQGNIYIYGVK